MRLVSHGFPRSHGVNEPLLTYEMGGRKCGTDTVRTVARESKKTDEVSLFLINAARKGENEQEKKIPKLDKSKTRRKNHNFVHLTFIHECLSNINKHTEM